MPENEKVIIIVLLLSLLIVGLMHIMAKDIFAKQDSMMLCQNVLTPDSVNIINIDSLPPVQNESNKQIELDFVKKNKKGFKEYLNKEDGSILIEIPAGEFKMGGGDGQNEETIMRAIYLDKYYIGKYEVTVGQYKKYCNDVGKTMPVQPEWNKRDNYPVVYVRWNDAKAYCDWAGLRLPTEAEWEKAARGTDGRKYPWGNKWNSSKCNSEEQGDNYTNTSPVGSFPSGVSPYGAYDMFGNVWEWCNNWYGRDYYGSSPTSNPTGPSSGSSRVLRGGGWYNGGFSCRYCIRFSDPPYHCDYASGFRPAK